MHSEGYKSQNMPSKQSKARQDKTEKKGQKAKFDVLHVLTTYSDKCVNYIKAEEISRHIDFASCGNLSGSSESKFFE